MTISALLQPSLILTLTRRGRAGPSSCTNRGCGGESAAQVTRDLGMSRATFYRRARALRQQRPQEQSETLDTER